MLLIVTFGSGFVVGWLTATLSSIQNVSVENSNNAEGNLPTDESALPDEKTSSNATVIETTQLSAGQRQLLESLGIDADEVVITPEMIVCAETKLGAARIAEIQNGATPSFFEGVQLLGCYR